MEKWAETETILKDFLVLYPSDKRMPTTQISLADVYMRQSKWDEAEEQLRKLSRMASLSQAEKMRMEVVRADVIQKKPKRPATRKWLRKGSRRRKICSRRLSPASGTRRKRLMRNCVSSKFTLSRANATKRKRSRANRQFRFQGSGEYYSLEHAGLESRRQLFPAGNRLGKLRGRTKPRAFPRCAFRYQRVLRKKRACRIFYACD